MTIGCRLQRMLLLVVIFVCPSGIAAQTNSDIYLFSVKKTQSGFELTDGKNITDRIGYDNQPCFHPEKPLIYFSSFDDDDRADIKVFNLESGETENFTQTSEREYSPTVTPDGKFISCIIQYDDERQELAKYPIEGGKASTIIDDLKVGYHCWGDDNTLIMFVLGPTMDLVLHTVKPYEGSVVEHNIGRALHKIPGQEAMSYIAKGDVVEGEDENDEPPHWVIQRLDLKTENVSAIAPTMPGREDIAWFTENLVVMSDGDSVFIRKVYPGQPSNRKMEQWHKVKLEGIELKDITRLVFNEDRSLMAIVAADESE